MSIVVFCRWKLSVYLDSIGVICDRVGLRTHDTESIASTTLGVFQDTSLNFWNEYINKKVLNMLAMMQQTLWTVFIKGVDSFLI